MARKTINDLLETGETLLWEAAPAPGRPVNRNGWRWLAVMLVTALTCFLAALAMMVVIPVGSVLAYFPMALVVAAAFATLMGLNATILERRRARARDRATRFAVTNLRALSLIGPYDFTLPLSRGTKIEYREGELGAIIMTNDDGQTLSFDRLIDAEAAQTQIAAQIEAQE